MLVKSNNALQKSSDAMREIALATKAESELMSALIGKSQRDSHTVKVLTYIALIYLPASLVAVSPLASARASFPTASRTELTDQLWFRHQGNLQLKPSTND